MLCFLVVKRVRVAVDLLIISVGCVTIGPK